MSFSINLIETSNDEMGEDEFKERFGTIVEEIDYERSFWCKAYYPLFLFRRFIYAIILVFLSDYPISQLYLSLVLTILPVKKQKNLIVYFLFN